MGAESPVFRLLLMGIVFSELVNFVNSQGNCPTIVPTIGEHYCRQSDRNDNIAKCCEDISYRRLNAFCDNLVRDQGVEGWRNFFNGTIITGNAQSGLNKIEIDRRKWIHVCGGYPGNNIYLAQLTDRLVGVRGKLSDYTNRLRFTDSVIAQEGLSFCIVGSHYRKSAFSHWDPLKPFLSLAEKSFDVGNHIDPEDSTKMNTFETPRPAEMRRYPKSKSGSVCGMWCNTRRIPDHRFEYVWLGQLGVEHEPWTNEYHVDLRHGFEKRPAHPEWQPDVNCKNPYRVTTTLIESDGLTLHNYLHIKVYRIN